MVDADSVVVLNIYAGGRTNRKLVYRGHIKYGNARTQRLAGAVTNWEDGLQVYFL